MERLKQILREAYEDPNIQLVPDLHIRELDNWNSFNHISMMINLETTYNIEFLPSEIEKISTVSDLLSLLAEKGVNIT